jgi:hypothetical protein
LDMMMPSACRLCISIGPSKIKSSNTLQYHKLPSTSSGMHTRVQIASHTG